jgi:hypothetical protein
MVQLDRSIESELCGGRFKLDQRDAISEGIMDPSHRSRFWRDADVTINQALVKTVARAKHQFMTTQPDRLSIAIPRDVPNVKNRHQACSIAQARRAKNRLRSLIVSSTSSERSDVP